MNVKVCHDAFYFLTFIDDYSRFSYVYMTSHHFEALDCFKRFLENVKNKNLKILQIDKG